MLNYTLIKTTRTISKKKEYKTIDMSKSIEKRFTELMNIMYELRIKCPWDKKQTPESLRQYLLEETYEVLDTIDQQKWDDLSKELGDLLLQIVFQSVIAEEKDRFTIEDVIVNINNKLIERHPHVFAETKVSSAEDVADNWEHIKMNSEKRKSLLSGIPDQAPALLYAQRMQEKASRVGFDWLDTAGVIEKIEEEIRELKTAVRNKDQSEIKEEIGDLLFSIVNLARFKNLNAEDCLRETNKKFKKRFHFIEEHYKNDFNLMKKTSLSELEEIWEKAKKSLQN
jgi:MazG family protein